MAFIILSPLNPEYIHFTDWVNVDVESYIIVNEKHFVLYKAFQTPKMHIVKVETWSLEEIFKTTAYITKHTKIDKIISYNENDVQLAALLRDFYSVPGQDLYSATFFRNKYKMVSTVSKCHFRVPNFHLVNSKYELYFFAKTNGYPIVLKPLSESGGRGIEVIHNLKEINRLNDRFFNKSILAEEYIDEKLYHIDGHYFKNHISFISISKYIGNAGLNYQSGNSSASVQIKKDSILYEKVFKYTSDLLKHVPSPENMLFHLEIFIDKDFNFTFCEIASRLGGGLINEMLSYQLKTSPLKIYFDKEMNNSSKYSSKMTNKLPHVNAMGFMLSRPKVGTIFSLPEKIPFKSISFVRKFAKIGDKNSTQTSMTKATFAFLIEKNTSQLVKEELTKIEIWLDKNIDYHQ